MTKVRVPDGKGGWVESEMEQVSGSKLNMKKAEEAFTKEQDKSYFIRVGKCTSDLNKFLQLYAKDYDLAKEEVVAAVYLENLNNRHFFPEGIEKYDALCKRVWAWFEENRPKK